ncbi:hypothetical protein Dsin_001679 [Dipteronia sinensis]|uniref:Cytochrome b5 heme-binding domain-containing protein n=1 Tax=Dipteronia sinensis TaxID=43782 RepID=A0AAE0B4G3_9ROSI|nr:hypothetical protein Dsin_001679 [Dipteronia sinensis]
MHECQSHMSGEYGLHGALFDDFFHGSCSALGRFDSKKPLLMAIKGHIYDVSQSRMFYGPGGPYTLFAEKDSRMALAKMSFEDKDLTDDTSGLGPFELEAL